MNSLPQNPADLLRQLRNLGLATRAQTDQHPPFDDPRRCAVWLIESGLLTGYQAEQLLAGQGKELLIGPYVLQQRLGGGGMGHVYRAEHRLLKRAAAVKIIGQVRRDGGDLPMLRRFQREVQAAGRLRHPGLVAVHDAGESDGRLYLAMEYIEGIDLERFVQETGPLPIDLACEVVRQTAVALHHAHEAELIHRDIKPSNLMLTPPGVSVKLLDLGLAQLADMALSAPDADDLGGTPNFMAPEWAADPQRIDARSDLYSLGCTFYYLLTGQVPFPGGSWTEKLLRHSLETPIGVRALRSDVPKAIAAVVERLMARVPEDRYASAADVAAALGGTLPAASADVARKVASKVQPRRKPRMRRFSCGAIAAILLGVAAAGGARWIVKPSSIEATSAPRATTPAGAPFTINNRSSGFASLEKAVAAARDGDVITIHGTGPFVGRPLTWRGKTLTVRAEGAARPRLEMRTNGDPWQALFRTDRPLKLEGLDLALASGCPEAPLIYGEGASLHLADCRLTVGEEGVAILARNPEEVVLRGCRIEAGAVALSVEVGSHPTCRLSLTDNHLTAQGESGAALSLWAPEVRGATTVRMELDGNTIQAGRMAALRALPPGLTITARGNRFSYRSALLSYSGCAERAAWRGTIWQGEGNSCIGPPAWLWIDGQPATAMKQKRPR